MGLQAYRKKRNFGATPEPESGTASKGALSFVVQRHHASRLHYDFRLEMEGVLKSWAVPKGPSMVTGEKRLAVMVEDHPLDYGKFYGYIPEGNYGAGMVEIWDKGSYRPMEKEKGKDPEEQLLAQLKKGDIKITLKGKYLKGSFALVRMNDGTEKNWLLIKKEDEWSQESFKIEKLDSLKKPAPEKKQKPEKEKRQKPPAVSEPAVNESSQKKSSIEQEWKSLQSPMMATLTESIQDDADWLYEMKYDGYRAVTKISNGKVEMLSRNGNSFNKAYKSLVDELKAVKDEVILDGEVVIENKEGISDFQLLQNYGSTGKGILKYYVFDILFVNGFNVSNVPLRQRKELLTVFFENNRFTHIIESKFITGKGNAYFKKMVADKNEGIIAKDMSGRYLPGKRSDTWLKLKSVHIQEVVIAGYTLPQKSRKYFGSLILGVYEGDTLRYAGNCGTGFTEASLKELHESFEKLRTKNCPFETVPSMYGTKGKPVWIKPELVCNVKFLQWTQDNRLRNPVFMGLRTDKDVKEVIRETTGEEEINPVENEKVFKEARKKQKLTNLGKIYWPEEGITKGQLLDYYERMGKYMLPYLKNRPQSLNRHPNGIDHEGFYQKDMDVDKIPDWLKTEKIYSKSNEEYIDYLICNDQSTLMYMANLGCIEINPWHSVYTKPDNPDYFILDLDPGDIGFKEVVKTALVIKDIADETGMDCYCKTSGATGLHVYFPLGARYDYDQVKSFAEILAGLAQQRLPDTTSIERAVAKRKDKIYIDFLQNRKGQTIAAPYSVRPKPHATVSTPLLWEEVNEKLTPQMFTIFNIQKRVEEMGDLWKGVLGKGISMEKVLNDLS